MSAWTLIEGDSVQVIPTLDRGLADLIVTDPPYSSGGMVRGDRQADTVSKYVNNDSGNVEIGGFDGDTRDQRSFAFWATLWLSMLRGVAKPGASALVFVDWRQLPAITDAVQAAGWVWRGIVPWSKTEATRPQLGRPRAQCEYIVFATNGPHSPYHGAPALPGFYEVPTERERVHITQKPVALMLELVRLAPPDGVVLDPFCGSGSTAVAAIRSGRRVVTVESNAGIASIARERLAAETDGLSLQAQRSGQEPLFGGEL